MVTVLHGEMPLMRPRASLHTLVDGSCNTDSSAVFFNFKGYYFPRHDEAGQPQVSDMADLLRYTLTPQLPNSPVPLLLCF